MKNPILNKLLQKHEKPVEKFVPPVVSVVTEDLTKQSPDAVARMTRRGLVWDSRKHRWVKPASSPKAPKSDFDRWEREAYPDIDNEAEEYAREHEEWEEQHGRGRELDRIQEKWDEQPIRRRTLLDNLLSRKKRKQKAFDKSSISDSMSTSSKLGQSGHYSDKEKEQRKKDAKFWEEKNQEYLRQHPEKRGGR